MSEVFMVDGCYCYTRITDDCNTQTGKMKWQTLQDIRDPRLLCGTTGVDDPCQRDNIDWIETFSCYLICPCILEAEEALANASGR
jgi:hypothetical protein